MKGAEETGAPGPCWPFPRHPSCSSPVPSPQAQTSHRHHELQTLTKALGSRGAPDLVPNTTLPPLRAWARAE